MAAKDCGTLVQRFSLLLPGIARFVTAVSIAPYGALFFCSDFGIELCNRGILSSGCVVGIRGED